MLKLCNITKEYKVDEEITVALHDVSIEFRKNEFVSILGPSGCGKTTLLNIVGGLDRYTSGDIQIDGISTKEYDDVDWDTYRNRRIGFVFQSYNLIPHMNVLKNVALCLTLAGVGSEERKERALEALRKVGLESQYKKKPNQLSGGQMQRVAIARALVNNPDIILADEPTGALDSESGIQVMDLLKEVAEDRLVVMVTHNPQLAEQYSTRIVYLKDGEVVGDSMPYDSAAEAQEKTESAETEGFETVAAENGEAEIVAAESVVEDNAATDSSNAETAENPVDAVAPVEVAGVGAVDGAKAGGNKLSRNVRKMSKWMKKRLKRREKDKSSMKLHTAISLSWNNLVSKKGRTFLTSIAGSIGIIGIILVLSLSNGVSRYIQRLEENALSQYPIEVGETNVSLTTALSILAKDTDGRADYPDKDEVYIKTVLGNFISEYDSIMAKNDLASFKKYIDKNFDTSLGNVKYDYGTTMNVYTNIVKDEENYMKVNPFYDSMEPYLGVISGMSSLLEAIQGFASSIQMSSWDEMSSDQKLLEQQYDLLGESKWPTSANEIVIVLDEKNQIIDYMQFVLGLMSAEEVGKMFNITGEEVEQKVYQVSDLLGLEYKVLTDADYFYYDNESSSYKSYAHTKSDIEFIEGENENGEDRAIDLKVVGVIRPKEGAGVTSINGVVGYTHALTELLINEATESDVALAQYEKYKEAVLDKRDSGSDAALAGMTDDQVLDYFANMPTEDRMEYVISIPSVATYSYSTSNSMGESQTVNVTPSTVLDLESYTDLMLEFGVADLARPKSISFYCASFDSKDKIVAFIDGYIKESGKEIKYTDYLSMIMGYVGTLTTTVTGVLVGFAAISLIVSTIMIAIIIYTSVLERRKEIGVLRSIGARKKDISRVFLAESAILGGYSGIIGLFFSYLISLFGSAILRIYFQIDGLMTITWWHCLMMFFISVFLSMFAGFIPSRIGARKDPAIALRSE